MFLALLVGFFVVLIGLLLLLLQTNIGYTEEALAASHALSADVATTELRRSGGSFGDSEIDSLLVSMRTRFNVDAVELRLNDGRRRTSGRPGPNEDVIARQLPKGRVIFYFDATPIRAIHNRFLISAAITVVAAAAGMILLLLYLPHVLRPIEAMLGDAAMLGEHRQEGTDEASYLIETFRRSIATMRDQERELKRLHEIEKSRADDLQMITSTLTRSLSSGFIAISPDGQLVEMNSSAREILEVPAEADVTHLSIAALLGNTPAAQRMEQAIAARETLSRQEIEIERSGGQTQVIGLTTVPLFAEASRFLGTIALFADLTIVRRLESRVRELQSLADLGVMSAGIAHEFRNSLSTILGFLKLARRNELAPEVASRLTSAETEALELADAVSGLLQFARPMRLQVTTVDLRQLIESIAGRLKESAPAAQFDIRGGPLEIAADPSVLSRAFENVLRNAVDATAESAEPRISIAIDSEPHPAVTIEDNGSGIDEQQEIGNLFLPFHSSKTHGVGMGLPLARKIVLLHGGTISIANRPGGGAVVRIELLDNAAELPQIADQVTA